MAQIQHVFAVNLKKIRLGQGLTQVALAKKANSAGSYIAMIENEIKFPSPDMIERLAKALNIDSTLFFTKQNQEFSHPWEWCDTIAKSKE